MVNSSSSIVDQLAAWPGQPTLRAIPPSIPLRTSWTTSAPPTKTSCAAAASSGGDTRCLRGRAVAAVVDDLRAVLFPGHFGATDLAPTSIRYYVGAQLDKLQVALTEQVRRGLSLVCDHDDVTAAGECRHCDQEAVDATEALVIHLPDDPENAGDRSQGGVRQRSGGHLSGRDALLLSRRPGDHPAPDRPRALQPLGPPDPAHHLRAGARRHRDRHPSGRQDRALLLHRSRDGRGHRRDLRDRRARAPLSGGDAGRARISHRSGRSAVQGAPTPDHRGRRRHLRRAPRSSAA